MMRRQFRHAALGLAAIGLGGTAAPALAQSPDLAGHPAHAAGTGCAACDAARAKESEQPKFRLFGGQKVRSDSQVRPTTNVAGTATVGGGPAGLTPIAPPSYPAANMAAPGMGMNMGMAPGMGMPPSAAVAPISEGAFSPEPTPIGMMSNVNTIGPNGTTTPGPRSVLATGYGQGQGYGPNAAPGMGMGMPPGMAPGMGMPPGMGANMGMAPGMGMPPGMGPDMVPPPQTFIPKGSSRAKTWLAQMFRLPKWRANQAAKYHQMELEQRRYEVMRENAMRGVQPSPVATYGQ